MKKYWKELPKIKKKNFETYLTDQKLDGDGSGKYIFRGLSTNPKEGILDSSFDRKLAVLENQGSKIPDNKRWLYEAYLLYEFKRRAHFYLKGKAPQPHDFLEWFSLMRHYGEPSRLVDFNYSFYLALYFAVHCLSRDSEAACIIAVNWTWLVNKVDSDLVEKGQYFQNPKVFKEYAMIDENNPQNDEKPRPFIVPVRPFRSNERIHVQQGLFLCPANINLSFEENLNRMITNNDDLKNNIKKIVISKREVPAIVNKLREMNISAETLYPGLAGFSESLSDLFYKKHSTLSKNKNKYLQSLKSNTDF